MARLEKTERGRRASSFTGGTLHADAVDFDLVDDGGVIAPGRAGAPGADDDRGEPDDQPRRAGDRDRRRAASDAVEVAGVARLGGALRITTRDGYAPRAGDSWTILSAGRGVRGSFTSVPRGYRVTVDGNRVVLTYGAPRRS